MAETYEVAFKEALNRTSALSLPVPEVPFSSARYLSKIAMGTIGREISQWFPNLRPEHLVGQCTTVHANLRVKVEELLKVPIYLTIGDVSVSGKRTFNVDDAYLDSLWNNRVTLDGSVKLHAWLTLPTMEIIDVTLSATLLALMNSQTFERHGNFVATGAIMKHADELKLNGDVEYHPYLVGQDYLQKIGALAYVNPQETVLSLFLRNFKH